jgi:hypothetical protein
LLRILEESSVVLPKKMKRKYEVLQCVQEHEKEVRRALSVAECDTRRAHAHYIDAVEKELGREVGVVCGQTIHVACFSERKRVSCSVKGYTGSLVIDLIKNTMSYTWEAYPIGICSVTGVQKPPYGRLFRGKIPQKHVRIYAYVSALDQRLPDGLYGLGQCLGLRFRYYMTEAGATYMDTKRAFYAFIWGCGSLFPRDIVKYLGQFVLSR